MSAALKTANQLKVQMTVVKGPHTGQVFRIGKSELTIGRGPENDVVLVNDPLVSRNHARIELVKNEFELSNLSEKNVLLVHGEKVQKSILVNDSTFQLGDSEIKFQFDLGHAVVSVSTAKPEKSSLSVAKLKPLATISGAVAVNNPKAQFSAPVTKNQNAATKLSNFAPQPSAATNPSFQNFQQPGPAAKDNNRLRFYGIIGLVLLVACGFLFIPNKVKSKKIKPTLKYEDEVEMAYKSKPESELRKKRAEEKAAKESPMFQRAEENFSKGMRDYQLGNYARAIDFFQVVTNLNPNHVLAKSYKLKATNRFIELVQAKLVLGESYYQKHNFSMCESMYRQVLNMLQGRATDQKYQLAEKMVEKCQFAAEGIR